MIGVCPYYCSKNNLYLPTSQEYYYKEYVETSFKRAGCGTITMLHDGVDDNYTKLIADPFDNKHWNNTTDNILYDTRLQTNTNYK